MSDEKWPFFEVFILTILAPIGRKPANHRIVLDGTDRGCAADFGLTDPRRRYSLPLIARLLPDGVARDLWGGMQCL